MESIRTAWHQAGQIGKHTKTLLLFTFVTAITSGMAATAHGQTFAEWFSQKKTQKKYLLEQLAALRVYGGYVKKGYEVAQNGLGSISSYLDNEYGVHSAYYDRLRTASPAISKAPQVREIITRQKDIVQVFRPLQQPDGLSHEETLYLGRVRSAVLHDCELQLQDLERLLTGGALKAGDRERLEQLNHIYANMDANYRFSCAFAVQVMKLIKGREQQAQDAKTSRSMRGIH
jgi:hypothetical protein